MIGIDNSQHGSPNATINPSFIAVSSCMCRMPSSQNRGPRFTDQRGRYAHAHKQCDVAVMHTGRQRGQTDRQRKKKRPSVAAVVLHQAGNAMSRGCRCPRAHCTAPSLFAPGKGGHHQIKAAPYRIATGLFPSGRRQLRFVRSSPNLVRDLASLSRSMTTAPAQQGIMCRDVHVLHSR